MYAIVLFSDLLRVALRLYFPGSDYVPVQTAYVHAVNGEHVTVALDSGFFIGFRYQVDYFRFGYRDALRRSGID
jgi:hypothetical protein